MMQRTPKIAKRKQKMIRKEDTMRTFCTPNHVPCASNNIAPKKSFGQAKCPEFVVVLRSRAARVAESPLHNPKVLQSACQMSLA